MDYNKFIDFWRGVVRQSVHEQGQELIAYAESLQSRVNIIHGYPTEPDPTFLQRVKTLWSNRSDW